MLTDIIKGEILMMSKSISEKENKKDTPSSSNQDENTREGKAPKGLDRTPKNYKKKNKDGSTTVV